MTIILVRDSPHVKINVYHWSHELCPENINSPLLPVRGTRENISDTDIFAAGFREFGSYQHTGFEGMDWNCLTDQTWTQAE